MIIVTGSNPIMLIILFILFEMKSPRITLETYITSLELKEMMVCL